MHTAISTSACNRRRFLKTMAAGAVVAGAAAFIPSSLLAAPATLPQLPYPENGLEPWISERTLSFHHGKHHAGYVKKTNDLVQGTRYASMSVEEIVLATGRDASQKGLFNNAAQVWNHNFYWKSMKPGTKAEGRGAEAVKATFGSIENFTKALREAGGNQFGSGWAWLAEKDGRLKILRTSNAYNPLVSGYKPLLVADVWEHAYYLDYQNKRGDYLKNFTDNLVNWDFISENLS